MEDQNVRQQPPVQQPKQQQQNLPQEGSNNGSGGPVINNNGEEPRPPRKGPRFNIYWVYGLIIMAIFALQFFGGSFMGGGTAEGENSFLDFQKKYLNTGQVEQIDVVGNEAKAYLKSNTPAAQPNGTIAARNAERSSYVFKIGSIEQWRDDWSEAKKALPAGIQEPPVVYKSANNFFREALSTILLPIIFIIAMWFLIMRKMGGPGGAGGGAGGLFNIGKSKAQLFEKGTRVNITFNDVAGLDEAKVEVMEIVDFLKNPKKYTNLGGKIPKGALLIGPPGTGKTLLAKAVAGEAQVPFFSMSGSDFVELFVGVGASRVRDLFKQAREKAPCIVFIDEIDAIGRARGKNAVVSNDERENTLNSLLVEMDGFSGDSGIIILAATNRPDVLDSALLRPGRFDRQISIDVPDVKGRAKIFEVHLQPIKKAPDLDITKLAVQTPGFAGADIANICNEAALIAARQGKEEVNMQDFNDAIDRVIGGLEKKNKIISPEEKKIIAYHEAGHAICGWFLEHAHPLIKVSIVPRGVAALGYAQYLPKEQYLYNTDQLNDQMVSLFGGRAAEEIIFGKISTGAQNDLERITKMAYSMVMIYGMNARIGNISFHNSGEQEYTMTKPYSDETARLIDEEVRALILTEYERTKQLLSKHIQHLHALAGELLKKEVLFKDDLTRIIGPRPYAEETTPDDFIPPVNSTVLNEGEGYATA